MPIAAHPRRFLVELIKPSHYDDDGYVIQWWKAWIPANSLSSVFGLTQDLAQRKVLGDDIEIEISATTKPTPLSLPHKLQSESRPTTV